MAEAGSVGTSRAFEAEHESLVLALLGLELRPLVGGEDAADSEEHAGVGFFELGPGAGDVIDLAQDLVGVGRIDGEHGLEQDLLLLDIGFEIDELETALLEDVVHALLLVRGERDLLGDVGILPPDTGRSDAEVGTHSRISGGDDAVVEVLRLAARSPGTLGMGAWSGWGRDSGRLLGERRKSAGKDDGNKGEERVSSHISSSWMRNRSGWSGPRWDRRAAA
jgi:hypothetical protein